MQRLREEHSGWMIPAFVFVFCFGDREIGRVSTR